MEDNVSNGPDRSHEADRKIRHTPELTQRHMLLDVCIVRAGQCADNCTVHDHNLRRRSACQQHCRLTEPLQSPQQQTYRDADALIVEDEGRVNAGHLAGGHDEGCPRGREGDAHNRGGQEDAMEQQRKLPPLRGNAEGGDADDVAVLGRVDNPQRLSREADGYKRRIMQIT